jgi:hypothetical protein
LVALQLKRAISKATKLQVCTNLSRILWDQHHKGELSDRRAHQLDAALKLRQTLIHQRIITVFTEIERKKPQPRKREASIARRRGLVAAGFLPPEIATQFTMSEQAVLTTLAKLAGECSVIRCAVDAIAARAAVSRSMVQKTIRKAHDMRLIERKIQKRKGEKNDFNLIRLLCPKWLGWLSRRIGWKKESTTNTQGLSTKSAATANPCIARESNPYQPAWKRMISRTSPGQRNTQSPLQRCSSGEAMNLQPDLADLIR